MLRDTGYSEYVRACAVIQTSLGPTEDDNMLFVKSKLSRCWVDVGDVIIVEVELPGSPVTLENG